MRKALAGQIGGGALLPSILGAAGGASTMLRLFAIPYTSLAFPKIHTLPEAQSTPLPAQEGNVTLAVRMRGSSGGGAVTTVNVRVTGGWAGNTSVNDLRRKLVGVTNIPVAEQALYANGTMYMRPEAALSTYPLTNDTASFVLLERLPAVNKADPIGGAGNFYAGHFNTAFEQTRAGLAIFFGSLNVLVALAGVRAARSDLEAPLVARFTSITRNAPAAHALHLLLDGERIKATQTLALMEACFLAFRKMVPRISSAGLARAPGVDPADGRVFEYSHACWAYLLDQVAAGATVLDVADEDGSASPATQAQPVGGRGGASSQPASPAGAPAPAPAPAPAAYGVFPPAWDAVAAAFNRQPRFRFVEAINLRSAQSPHPALVVDVLGGGLPVVYVARPKDNAGAVTLFDPLTGDEHRRDIDAFIQAAGSTAARQQATAMLYVAYGSAALPAVTTAASVGAGAATDGSTAVPLPVRSRADFMRAPREALCVLVDTSQSMLEVAFPGSTDLGAAMRRIDAVRQMFLALANRSAAYDYPHLVSLVSFGMSVSTVCKWTESWTEFADSLGFVQPLGQTLLWDGLDVACRSLTDLKRRYELHNCRLRVLVLTDGRDDGSSTAAHVVARKLQEAEVVVDAVMVGDELDLRLKPVCVATGGGLFRPQTMLDAISLFEDETFLCVRERQPVALPGLVNSDEDLEKYNNHKRYRFAELGDRNFRRTLPDAVRIAAVKPATALAGLTGGMDEAGAPSASARAGASAASRSAAPGAHAGAGTALPRPSHRVAATVAAASSALAEGGDPARRRFHRITLELRRLVESPVTDFEVYPSSEDLYTWRILLRGPAHTPYEGGVFELFARFPDNYPLAPPEIRFVTPIIHCNINSTGKICHRIFDRNYEPRFSFAELMLNIVGLLMTPEPSDPLDSVLADLFRSQPYV